MKITALIRTHPGREELCKRAIQSAADARCDIQLYEGEKTPGYEYNLYCNILKAQVTEGYFFFLDSDDFVMFGALDKIKPCLAEDRANIVQMLRNGQPRPKDDSYIKRGFIGMPCLILHHSHKHLADITATEDGDWRWIYEVKKKLSYQFFGVPLVNAGSRSHGK